LASRGIAFVKFAEREQAARAIESMDGAMLNGGSAEQQQQAQQPLQVRWAKERRSAEAATASFSQRQHPGGAVGRYADAQQGGAPGSLSGYMQPQMMYQPMGAGGVGFVPPHMMMPAYAPYAMQPAPMGAMPVPLPVPVHAQHPGAPDGMYMAAYPGAGGPAPMAPPPPPHAQQAQGGPPGYFGAGPPQHMDVHGGGYVMPHFGPPPPHMLAYHPAAAAGFAGPSGPFPPHAHAHAHAPFAAHPQLAFAPAQQTDRDAEATLGGQSEPPEPPPPPPPPQQQQQSHQLHQADTQRAQQQQQQQPQA